MARSRPAASRGPKFFRTPGAFRAWLTKNGARAGVLVVGFRKVGSGKPSITWSEAVDEALCVGWIDGVRKRIDAHSYLIRFTPRKPTSNWSAINIDKVRVLTERGRTPNRPPRTRSSSVSTGPRGRSSRRSPPAIARS
jgi:uncharacterized protein YdeI (YjbR/CyaY-like superfamily)